MSLKDELDQVINDLPFSRSFLEKLTGKKHHPERESVAHFCEHYGIYIYFTRARTTWSARVPSAIKPWWLFLEPLKTRATGNNSRY